MLVFLGCCSADLNWLLAGIAKRKKNCSVRRIRSEGAGTTRQIF